MRARAEQQPVVTALRLRGTIMLLTAASAIIAAVPAATAQAYPSKPIRLLVGFPPGGAADITARIVGKSMAADLGQQVIIDDRPGAGSAIASEITAKAPADGYTLVMIATSHAVNASFGRKLPYDSVADFSAISLAAGAPLIIVASPSLPIKSVADLVELARAQPAQINFASGGTGSISHLAGALFNYTAGVQITHVPYKGAGQSLPDVMSGQMQLLFSSLPAVLSQIRAGRVKAIAVTSSKRTLSAPDIPSVAESGYPNYEATSWTGVLAPAATSKDIVAKLNAAIRKTLAIPEVIAALVREGEDPIPSTPGEFQSYLKSEIAKWTKVVREAHINPN